MLNKDNQKIKVGIGFATGRSNFMNVLKCQYKNWEEEGIIDNPNISVNVFIAYDITYNNIDEKEFLKVPKEVEKGLDNIVFIGEEQIDYMCKKIREEKTVSKESLKEIFGSHGYGKLRNSILYTAIKEDIDYLLFLDDDEYPVVPIKKENGELEWVEQKILSTHLKYIKDCDITFGYHCGYISPIPYFDFGKDIDENLFKSFIKAISNDIINWEETKKLIVENKGITYGNSEILNKNKTQDIKLVNGAKWVAGSNLCLNLKKMKNIYPFYNPPNARGEDTFFSTCLKTEKVLKIPVYSFHDGFLKYACIMNKVFPKKLEYIKHTNKDVKERFYEACLGWIRYKPLLLYITHRKEYVKKINKINKDLDDSIPSICSLFNTDNFYQMKKELDFYNAQVKKHYEQFKRINETWDKITKKDAKKIKINEIQNVDSVPLIIDSILPVIIDGQENVSPIL